MGLEPALYPHAPAAKGERRGVCPPLPREKSFLEKRGDKAVALPGMKDLNYEAEYNNSARVPEFPVIAARWQSASAAYRQVARAELNLPYGTGERQRYDLFFGNGASAPLVVYVHGGYWQWTDRSMYSFVATTLNAAGLDVAIPSYSLCPDTSVLKIIEELQACLANLWRKTKIRPLVIGHSAGGHLTSAMLGTRWESADGVPDDLVGAGLAISGIFDLRPLVHTTINQGLGLDDAAAKTVSPRFWPPPPRERTFVAVVGANESSEFRRQSRDIADHWRAAGVRTECIEIEGANHFTVLDQLAQAGSTLNTRVIGLAHEVHNAVARGHS
jgi:arylformamidase